MNARWTPCLQTVTAHGAGPSGQDSDRRRAAWRDLAVPTVVARLWPGPAIACKALWAVRGSSCETAGVQVRRGLVTAVVRAGSHRAMPDWLPYWLPRASVRDRYGPALGDVSLDLPRPATEPC